jgi:hypothetical protein
VPVRVREVTLTREHPLESSLGRLEVSGVAAEISAADLQKLASAPRTTRPSAAAPAAGQPPPFAQISVDGTLVVKTGEKDQAVKLDFAAATVAVGGRADLRHWQGSATVAAPGLDVTLTGDYDAANKMGAFQLTAAQADLETFRAFVGVLLPLPLADWETRGTLTATGAGTWQNGKLTARLSTRLRGGHLANPTRTIVLDGVAADLEFTDLKKLTTAPAQPLSAAHLSLGAIQLSDVTARLQFTGAHDLRVESLAASAFGGKISTEPFSGDPSKPEGAVTANFDALQLEQLLPLLPPKVKQARGLIGGHVPVRYDGQGVHLGRGWVRLGTAAPAYLLYQYPEGMLTRDLGISAKFAAYAALKAVETARLPIRVRALSIELHPPDAPAGRYATIHLEAEPDDPKHPVPLNLSLNLNGPVEELLDWSLKSHLKVSAGGHDKH